MRKTRIRCEENFTAKEKYPKRPNTKRPDLDSEKSLRLSWAFSQRASKRNVEVLYIPPTQIFLMYTACIWIQYYLRISTKGAPFIYPRLKEWDFGTHASIWTNKIFKFDIAARPLWVAMHSVLAFAVEQLLVRYQQVVIRGYALGFSSKEVSFV